jgi:hypothetical protein
MRITKSLEPVINEVVKDYIKNVVEFDLDASTEQESALEDYTHDSIIDFVEPDDGEELTEEEDKEYDKLLAKVGRQAIKISRELRKEYTKQLKALQAETLRKLR